MPHTAHPQPQPRLAFLFFGRPQAVQSFRFARTPFGMRKFQPQAVVDWKNRIRLEAVAQLPLRFAPFADTPLRIEVEYLFSPPKSLPKHDFVAIQQGRVFFKTTRPDLADNLNKGLLDALTGIVWKDDSVIVEVYARKVYTAGTECTRLLVTPLPQGFPPNPRTAAGPSTSQRQPENAAADLPLFAGKADCFGPEAPRSASGAPSGQLATRTAAPL